MKTKGLKIEYNGRRYLIADRRISTDRALIIVGEFDQLMNELSEYIVGLQAFKKLGYKLRRDIYTTVAAVNLINKDSPIELYANRKGYVLGLFRSERSDGKVITNSIQELCPIRKA